MSPIFPKLSGTRVHHGGGPSDLADRWPVWVCCSRTPAAGEGQGAPFMSMWMSTAASTTKNLPPDPLASRGQKNRRRKNTLHNTLCNKPQKLIAGAGKRKNREIMLRPCCIVLSPWHEGEHRRARDFRTGTPLVVARHWEEHKPWQCTQIHRFPKWYALC